MTGAEAVAVALACAGGAALQAGAGFGFALVAAPVAVRVLGPEPAVGLLGALSVLVNGLTLGSVARGRAGAGAGAGLVLWPELRRLAPAAVAGLLAGGLLLGVVPDAALQVALAAAVLVALLVRRGSGRGHGAPGAGWRWATGFAAGAMTTTIGVNGPPLVLWLRARRASPEQARATLAVAFLVAGAATVLVLAALGDLHPGGVATGGGALGTALGFAVGRRRAAGMAVARHERLVTAVLILSAVTAAVAAVS